MNDKLINDNTKKYKNLKIMQSLSAPRGNLLNIKQKSRQKVVSNNFDTSVALSNDPKCTSIQNTLNKSVKFNSTITTCYNYNFENNLTNKNTKIKSGINSNNNIEELQTNNQKLKTKIDDISTENKKLNKKIKQLRNKNLELKKEKH